MNFTFQYQYYKIVFDKQMWNKLILHLENKKLKYIQYNTKLSINKCLS